MQMTLKIRRALLSVSDKTGLEMLARALHQAGVAKSTVLSGEILRRRRYHSSLF